VNDRSEQTILVNRLRWKAISDKRVKAGIVLHEILSLAGLEETGFYPISSRYVIALGASSEAIKPVKDNDQTYLSCVDTKSALLVLSISPTYRMNSEIRALGEKSLQKIRGFARTWGIYEWEQVVAVSFSMQAKALGPSTVGQPNDSCKLDLFNRTLLSCSENAESSRAARDFVFKLQDGSVVKTSGADIQFGLIENNYLKRLEMKLVADLPIMSDGGSGTVFMTFPLNPDSCR